MGDYHLHRDRHGIYFIHHSLACERSNEQLSDNVDERLYDIYEGICDVIVQKLKAPSEVTAADIQAYRGFLKDNGITSLRRPGNKLDEAASAAEEFEEFPFAVPAPVLPKDDPAVKAAASE